MINIEVVVLISRIGCLNMNSIGVLLLSLLVDMYVFTGGDRTESHLIFVFCLLVLLFIYGVNCLILCYILEQIFDRIELSCFLFTV